MITICAVAFYVLMPKLQMDIETAYWSKYGRLEWLEYNIKHSMEIECALNKFGLKLICYICSCFRNLFSMS